MAGKVGEGAQVCSLCWKLVIPFWRIVGHKTIQKELFQVQAALWEVFTFGSIRAREDPGSNNLNEEFAGHSTTTHRDHTQIQTG